MDEPARYAVDGIAPRRVLAPASDEEAAEALAAAAAAGEGVIPVGGGTMLWGEPPSRYDLALSTAALTGIMAYQPADLTLVARAGTPLADIDAALAEHGQFLPLNPALPA